jgi:hypothetical protein
VLIEDLLDAAVVSARLAPWARPALCAGGLIIGAKIARLPAVALVC